VLRAAIDDGTELVYRDIRRIGTLLLLGERDWQDYDSSLGPEPLDPTLDAARFGASSATPAGGKKVLMDQRKIVGVGNIYANEALFAAGIDPSKPAHRLDADAHARLLGEVQRILRAAIDSQGTTFRDYRTGPAEPGNFQLELAVYGREGEPCRICGTRLAHTHDIDARITVFCHRCQR
jgi:formamidopyrimidine-DNA glycosylase